MYGKKIVSLALCLLITTVSLGVITVKADDFESSTTSVDNSTMSYNLWFPPMGRLIYHDGKVSGTNLYFNLNETTGIVTNYSLNFTIYPAIYRSSFNSRPPVPDLGTNPENITHEKITIFHSITLEGFAPVAMPNSFADYLVFQGKNIFMKFGDQVGGNVHYASSNESVKIRFEVPNEFNITRIDPYSYPPYSALAPDGSVVTSDQPIIDDNSTPWKTVYLISNNTQVTVSIYNGTVSIDGQILEVNLNAYGSLNIYAMLSFSTPTVVSDFWYNDLNITQDKSVIENAKNNGLISADGWYTNNELQPPTNQVSNQIIQGDITTNYYTYDDSTFNMNFNSIDGTGVEVIVDSQIPTGRIVIINVDKELLQTTSVEKLLVSFDSAVINPIDTLEVLMEKVQNKDMDPAYYVLSGERLITVFVYVPHFSSHTISIKTITSTIGEISNILLPFILALLFVTLIIGGIILQKRKKQDEF